MDLFNSMAVFAKTVEAGSFSAAADALTTSSQVVGRHVKLLEDHLGVKLINRTTRRHSLTDLGRSFYERVRTIMAEVEAAEALAAETRVVPRGQLRINAPVTFGVHVLAKALPDYLHQYPEVDVELSLVDRMVDLIDEGYDAVFRVGTLAENGLIARSLQPQEFVLCAAPAYLQKHGEPSSPADLKSHECLSFAYGLTRSRWSFTGSGREEHVDISCRLLANNGQALLSAAVAGLGLLLQPVPLVDEAVEAGALVRLLPDWTPMLRPMHILYAPDRRITPKLRTFIDFAIARFG